MLENLKMSFLVTITIIAIILIMVFSGAFIIIPCVSYCFLNFPLITLAVVVFLVIWFCFYLIIVC